MIKGAVDIGSNTLRLIIAEVVSGKITNILYEERHIIRLAEGIKVTGVISEEAYVRLTEALRSIKSAAKKYSGMKSIRFVATSALREAKNKDEIIKKVKDSLDIDIEVITPEQEAEYMFKGVAATVDITNKKSLLFDIGGGSTEYIITEKDKILFNKSFDLGVVKLADEFDFKSNVNDKTLGFVYRKIEKIISEIIVTDVDIAIATAGTATTLAAIDLKLVDYDYRKVNNYKLSYDKIMSIFNMLCGLSLSEREKVIGLEKGRADLIIPGTAIVIKTMELFNIKELTISDFGLREGLIVSNA